VDSKPDDPVLVASRMGMLQEPSEEFLDAFREGSSGMVVDCEFCGRVYFATRDCGDYDEGELEDLRARAAKEPDKYIEVDYFTTRVSVDGKGYADGCRCNMVRRYEDWIWANRRGILAYLQSRTERRLKEATEEADSMRAVMAVVKGSETEEEAERKVLRDLLRKYPREGG